MKSDICILLVSIALVFITCAYRDNVYDPNSPLYRPDPPMLSVFFEYDSSKISKDKNDTIYAYTPFNFKVSATSKGGFDQSIDLEVYFFHFLNGAQKELNILEDSVDITLNDSGVHLFHFKSSENDNTPTAIEQKVICLSHKSPPKIIDFKCSDYKLITKKSTPVFFHTEINDSNSLLEKIVYSIPNQNSFVSIINKHSDILTDTLHYTFLVNDTGIQEISLKTYDVFDRCDSAQIKIHFEDKKDPLIPPKINEITFSPKKVKIKQDIKFNVDFSSPYEKIKKYWSYGDSKEQVWTEDSVHQFNNPGFYQVMVKVGNETISYSFDTITVQVFSASNIPPEISAFHIEPKSDHAPLKVRLSVKASDSDGERLIFRWIFGVIKDTGTDTIHDMLSDSVINFTFWYPGKYPVTIMVMDEFFGTASLVDTVTVTGDKNDEPFLTAYPSHAFIFQEINFKLDNLSPDDSTFTWMFPFDTLETSYPKINHIFKYYGEYNIKVKINDDVNKVFSVPVKIVFDMRH